MPKAHAAYEAAQARIPRTLFEHAHRDGSSTFPANIFQDQGEIFLHFPDNWNGLDELGIWLFGSGTEADMTINITVNIATLDELFNTHTQTVNAIAFSTVANEYEYIDLTAIFAAVLANLNPRDLMWIIVDWGSGDTIAYLIGAEAQET